MNKILTVFYLFWAPFLGAQNQLPLANGEFEDIDPGTYNFSYWTNLQTNGGQVNYSIETENLIPGSSKAQKSQIISILTHLPKSVLCTTNIQKIIKKSSNFPYRGLAPTTDY